MNVTELFEELDKYFEREAVTLNDPTNQQKIVTYLSNEGVRVSIDNEVHNCIFQVCCLILENELWLYFVQRTARIKILFNNQNITFNKSVTDFLTISASKPYLLSGETTDLIVTLHNGFGVPLANKSVTVSDGTSSYSGITNSKGIFTLYSISVSTDTTFTATYSNATGSCLVELCDMVDYGVTSNNNAEDWNNSNNRLTVTLSDNGKTLTGTSNYGYYITKNYAYTDYIVEFDVVELTALVSWYVRTSASDTQIVGNLSTLGVRDGDNVKIVVQNNSLQLYINGTLKSTIALTIASAPMDCGFRITNQSTKYITFKNFRVHTL